MTDKHMAGCGTTIDTQRLRELIAKATPGPWNSMAYRNGSHRIGHGPNYIVADIYWPADGSDAQVNATLIAETRNALPALLNHIDAQAAEIAWLRNSAWTNGDVQKQANAEATKLRSDNAHLRATLSQSLMALEGYLPNHRNDVTDRAISAGRAALSGEGK